jgi:hypothetical protein
MISFFPVFLLAGPAFAQEYVVKGIITDEKGKAVDAGNVILLDAKDSSLVTGNFFMEGKFEIKGATSKAYILKVAAISYHEHYQPIINSSMQAVLDVGTVVVKSRSLKEVEVIATVPLITNQGDRMVVNIENTLLSQSGTAMDVMEGAPGILVGTEGNISVFGKGDAVIYIDGQLANAEILRSIPSSEIKQVEIITKPSAMYDAQGRAVVNVVTKKGALNGYQSELYTQQTVAKKYYSFYGGNFSYRKNRFSVLARYSFTSGMRWSREEYTRSFTASSVPVIMLNSIEEWRSIKGANYYGLGFRYSIDSVSTIGLMGTGSFSKVTKETANTNLVTLGSVQEEIRTFTTGLAQTDDSNLNLTYNRKLDTTGSLVQVQGAYSLYNRVNSSDIDEEIADSAGTLYIKKRNKGTNGINILTAQADYTKAFTKEKRLEAGLKYSNIFNESSVIFQRLGSNSEWVDDASINNGFSYDEKNAAAYVQYRYSKKKWEARIGVRSELSDIYGFSKRIGQKVVDSTYINFFPNAYAGYAFTKDLKLTLDYSYRINRPGYQDLDPFINYIDSLSSIRGNPYLRPEYTHSISTSLVYLEAASIDLSYSYTAGLMDMYIEKVGNGSNQFYGQTRNFKSGDEFSAGLVLPYQDKRKIYTTYNAFGYLLKNYAYAQDIGLVTNSAASWYAYSYHKLVIKDLTLDAMFNYFSGGAEGMFIANRFYSLRASAQYTLLNDKLTIRFVANDILNSAIQSARSHIPGFDLTYKDRSDTHFYRLAMSYRFGRLKQKAIEEDEINKEERDRIKN